MVATPTLFPVTVPPLTEAIDELLLLHVPAGVASVRLTVLPWQITIGVAGLMATGDVFTVTVAVAEHAPIA